MPRTCSQVRLGCKFGKSGKCICLRYIKDVENIREEIYNRKVEI